MEWLKGLRRRTAGRFAGRATFHLFYEAQKAEPLLVGKLHYDGDEWIFAYSPEFQKRTDLRPLEGFDDVRQIYRSKSLFPFFAVRIPDEDRIDVRRTLEQEGIKSPSPADMLRLFGRRNVSSPSYELRASER